MKTYKVNFVAPLEDVQSVKFHPLTTNGPFIDAHFGPLNEKTPAGQTYYIRPLTEYTPPCKHGKKSGCGCGGKGDGCLTMKLKECYPAVHANTNTVSTDFSVSGTIKVTPFEWQGNVAKVFPNQKIEANTTVKNKTGLKMKGYHVHDGQNKNGLTSFGPISYFLYTTSTWQNLPNTKYSPLPPNNVALKNPTPLLKYSKSIE